MQNTRVNNFCVFALLFMAVGCMNRSGIELSLPEFMSSIEQKSSGLFSKTIGNVTYCLQYKPVDYVICKELNESPVNSEEYKELKAEYEKFEYYTLEMQINDSREELLKYKLTSEKEYSDRVNYYAFKFQKDLKLVQDNDTLNCTAYHFERNYGLSPKVRFLLAFNKMDDKKARTFVCDEPYLGNGIVKINISPDDIKEIPKLKLK